MRGATVVGIAGLFGITACALTESILLGHSTPKPLPAIEGPEDAALLEGIEGVLLESPGDHELVIVDLPSLSRRRLDLRGSGGMVSGPDAEGRIVYGHRTRVWSRDLNTQRDEILADFAARSSTVTTLAIAPRRGRVLLGLRVHDPGKPEVAPKGELVLCTVGQAAQQSLGSLVVGEVSWFPDSRRAAVEIWVDRTEAAWSVKPQEYSDASWTNQQTWPTVQILDCETGDLQWVAWGTNPCVSPDGRSILFGLAPESPLRLRDFETGAERAVELPGFLRPSQWRATGCGEESVGRCYGWLNDRTVAYDAVGTVGQDPGYVPSEGLQGHYPKWTVKAADVATGAFCTLIQSTDFDVGYSIGVERRGWPSRVEGD